MIIFENEKLKISTHNEEVYLTVNGYGITTMDFNGILSTLPQIKLSSFTVLQGALQNADSTPVKIGSLKPEIELEISSDEMSAFVRVNFSQDKCHAMKTDISTKILNLLHESGISEGILSEALESGFKTGQKLLVARGKHPTAGQDAKYRYYKLSERKPELDTTGKTDHYELNLIDNVKKYDWLGEKRPPIPGTSGYTIYGRALPPKSGRDYSLKYDKGAIDLIVEDGIEVLRAKHDGAVRFKDGKITVDNHLHIHGDVDFSTGNIKFDGFVTIEGTVKDKFSVEATKDIEIKGANGVGAVARIESQDGSIYIRGGINGKNEAMIIAKTDIFAKFSNEAILLAGNTIHIGLYAIDSTLKADCINLDPQKGRIIGGEIHAAHKISAGSIGNAQERKTKLNVQGFERLDIKTQLEATRIRFQEIISKANHLKRQLEIFEMNFETLDPKAKTTYKGMMVNYENIIDDINRTNKEVVRLENMLRTRGEGEVKVMNNIFPRTFLEIKSIQKHVNKLMKGSFYVKDRQLHTALD